MRLVKVLTFLLHRRIFSRILQHRMFKTLSRLFDIFRLDQCVQNFGDNSSLHEYEVLNQMCNKLQIINGYVLDVAASDGYSQSCTLGFFRRAEWSGFAVEMDPLKFSKLAFLYAGFPNTKLAKVRVTPDNIDSLLSAYEVPKDISVFNLDIDSYDLYVMEKVLKSDYRPRIISMEINEKIPSGIFFAVDYDSAHSWQGDHFYGCSIDAASLTVKPYGYKLVSLEFNNAVFILDEHNVTDFLDLTAENAYNTGYRNAVNRKILFPHNTDVDVWLTLNKDDCLLAIRNTFAKYEGKYSLSIV
jgi:hypothetical protein